MASVNKKKKLKNSYLHKTYLSGGVNIKRVGFYSKKERRAFKNID